MARERELRLALVCYGGVSLAVYMHGIVKELWKLLRASEARGSGRATADAGDTERVWRAFLDEVGRTVDLRVMADILAGASAGGINAILLAEAMARGLDLEPLTAMWLEKADVDQLLDPGARPEATRGGRLARFYKEPVAWMAARRSAALATVDDPAVRAEMAFKLGRFVRSRWFAPPFSGEGMTAMLDDALDAMEAAPRGPSLVPPAMPIDLSVTVTDYWGRAAELSLNSPPVVVEREHRRLITFSSPPLPVARAPDGGRLGMGARGGLLFAARATASLPGAFPPAAVGEIDRHLAARGRDWPGREAFLAAQLAGDRPPDEVLLIDGSVLSNAPFGPALAALRTRTATREVDRRIVYLDPKPGVADLLGPLISRAPGFFTVIARALADLPRGQPIRDSIEAANRLSERVRRVRHVTDAMTPSVDAAVGKALGRTFFLMLLSPERLARARSRLQSEAARAAGFAYSAYAQLKLIRALDEAARLAAEEGQLSGAHARDLHRDLASAARERGAFDHDRATRPRGAASPFVALLRGIDLGFRVRRLRFFARRLTMRIARTADDAERQAAEALKGAVQRRLMAFEQLRNGLSGDGRLLVAAAVDAWRQAHAPDRPGAAADVIDALSAALDMEARDAEVDAILVAAAGDARFGPEARRDLFRSWLGYPFYDIAVLPMLGDGGDDAFDELKVDRIAPDDAPSLRAGGTRACLKGWQLNAFAGFFSRAYRENDYLWGRLHAAERLVEIIGSSVPDAALDLKAWKARLFRAILASERARLRATGALIDELEKGVGRWTGVSTGEQ